MTNQPKHTETPYEVYTSPFAPAIIKRATGKPNKVIAICRLNKGSEDMAEAEANAQFVVTACNNHEKLVVVLKEIKHLIDTHELSDVILSQVISGICYLALSQIEKAGE